MRTEEDDEEQIFKTKKNLYRKGNHIYFYDVIDDESQKWLQLEMKEAYQELIIQNAAEAVSSGAVNEQIYLHINSPGGSVINSLALYDYIKDFPIIVVGLVEGLAASGASIMLCACHLRQITKHSFVLIHQLSSYNPKVAKYEMLKDDMLNNDLFMESLKKIYLSETKLTKEELTEALKHDIYWDAAKSVACGLCDVITNTKVKDKDMKNIDKKINERFNA